MTATAETVPGPIAIAAAVLSGPSLSDLTPGTLRWAQRWLAEARSALWHSYNESPEQVRIPFAKREFWCNRKELAALEFERLLDLGDIDETWALLGTDHDVEFTMRAYRADDDDGTLRHTLAPVEYIEGLFCEVEEFSAAEPAMVEALPWQKPEARAVYAERKLRSALWDLQYDRKGKEYTLPWFVLWSEEVHGGDTNAALAELETKYGTATKVVWIEPGTGVELRPVPGTGGLRLVEDGFEESRARYTRPDGTETAEGRPETRTVPGPYHALLVALKAHRAAQKPEATPEGAPASPEDEERWKARDARMAAAGERIYPGMEDRSQCKPGHPTYIDWHRKQDAKEAEQAAAEEAERQAQPIYRACAAISRWQPREPEIVLVAPPVRWLVDRIIPAGKVGTIIGAGGVSKTTLMIHLAMAVATGNKWLDYDVCETGTTVLLSGEDEQDDLDGALANLLAAKRDSILASGTVGFGPDEYESEEAKKGRLERNGRKAAQYVETVRRSVRLISLRGMVPAFTKRSERGTGFEIDAEVRQSLAEALAEIPDLRLVIPDTLRRFAQAPSVDEEAMNKAIMVAEFFAEAIPTRPTVIVPHHTTKESFRKGVTDQYAAHGSGAIVDSTRFGLNLRKLEDKEVEEAFEADPSLRVMVGDYIYVEPSRGSLRVKKEDPFLILRRGWYLTRARTARMSPEEKKRNVENVATMVVLARIEELEKSQGEEPIAAGLVFETVPCKNGKEGARLKELASRGLVTNRNAGKKAGTPHDWRLTEKGREALNGGRGTDSLARRKF